MDLPLALCFNPAMASTLVTGFSPFDGRQVNASWIAARSLAQHIPIETLEIPVVWSEPARQLQQICNAGCPEIIISMGEGREGWFDIETVARNVRRERPDNHGSFPNGEPISEDGPHFVEASIDAARLHARLAATGFPVRVSRDAGAFLCEETLYTLEMLRDDHPRLGTVVFVHLPPYGTSLTLSREPTLCNEDVLSRFSRSLYDAVMDLHANRCLE